MNKDNKKAETKQCTIPVVKGWLSFDDNTDLFTKYSSRNCRCLFDDGTICRYNDNHPFAILTHFEACP
jgi:hypothetical protein